MAIFGHYIFLAVCGFLTGILCLGLALLLLNANPHSKSCRLAFFFNLAVASWSICYGIMYFVGCGKVGDLVNKILTCATILLSVLFTHFVLLVLKKERLKIHYIGYACAFILISVTFFTDLLVDGARPKLGLPAYTHAGPLYWILPLLLFSNLIYSLKELAGGIKKSKGFKKNKLLLFFIAAIVGYGAGTPAFLLVFDIPVKPYTTPLVCFYPMILTYAVVKHRFLDIKKLASKTLLFSMLFFLLVSCVAVVLFVLKEGISRFIGISEPIAQLVATGLAIAFYGPLKKGLSRLTNKMLLQHVENPEKIFRNLSQDILYSLDLEKLAHTVTSRLAEILVLERIGFYVRTSRTPYIFDLVGFQGKLMKKEIHQSKIMIQYLESSGEVLVNPYTFWEKQGGDFKTKKPIFIKPKEIKVQALRELARLGAVAAFPIFVKGILKAVLVMGRKKSDAAWRDEEFAVLKSFARHLSLALANADQAEIIKKTREQTARTERDSLAGALIVGIDHEAKIPLQCMTSGLECLEKKMSNPRFLDGPREKVVELISSTMQSILLDTERVHNIISYLGAERKPLKIEDNGSIDHIVKKVIKSITSTENIKKVTIQSKIPANLRISCDLNALDEILTNLIRNAVQAIPYEGEVMVQGFIEDHETLIRIKDTGMGMSEILADKIFEPFFTTKKRSETGGAGMGLFIAKEYMLNMGGRIEVNSIRGQGTTFSLCFPSIDFSLKEAA